MTGDELLSLAVLGALVFASPPIYCILLFRLKKFLAWQIRFWQRLFKFERKPGEEWPAVKIDPWPSSLFRFFLGAPRSEYARYSADEPETFPWAINQVRISGLILFVVWCILTPAAFCGMYLIITTGQG